MTNQTTSESFAELVTPVLQDGLMQVLIPSLKEALKTEYKIDVPTEFFSKVWDMKATTTAAPKTARAPKSSGEKTTCMYLISRGIREGQPCGKTAMEGTDPARCKACLNKGGGKKTTEKASTGKAKTLNNLLGGKIKSNITGTKPETKNVMDDLIKIDDSDYYHHKPSGLVVEVKDKTRIAVGKVVDDDVDENLTDEDKTLATKYGIIVKNAETEAEVTAPARKSFKLNSKT